MARMRCGAGAPVSGKLNFPLASALVVAATFIPLVNSMRRTSSPAAGLLVVPLVTVPERVWASAEARASEKMMSRRADFASWVKSTPCCRRSFLQNAIALRNQCSVGFGIADREHKLLFG